MATYKLFSPTENVNSGESRIWENGQIYTATSNISSVPYNDKSTTPVFNENWIKSSENNYLNLRKINKDNIIFELNTSSEDISFILLDGVDFSRLKENTKYFFINTGDGVLDINPNGTNIDGTSTGVAINKEGYLELLKVDNEWRIIDKKGVFTFVTAEDIPNLELWLDASELSQSQGSEITTWNDLSGNNHNFTGSSGATPIVSNTLQNGKKIALFDGSNDVMSAGDIELYNNSRGFTMISVVHPLDNTRRAVLSKYQTTGNNREFDFGNGANYLFEDLTWSSRTTYTISLPNDLIVYAVRWKPGQAFEGLINGNLTETGDDIVNDLSDGTANFKMGGGDYTSVGYWNGRIAEIAVYSDYVSDIDLNNYINYLTTKWGLDLEIAGIINDDYAIHVNKSGEIDSIDEKTILSSNDLLVIEDFEDNNNKKKVLIDTIKKAMYRKTIQLSKSSSQTINNGSDTYITWDNEEILDDIYSWSNDEITFLEDGVYRITIDFSAERSTGTTRSTVNWILQYYDGSWNDVDGTARATYHRTNSGQQDRTSASITKILEVNSGDKIQLVAVGSSTNLQTLNNGCNLIIEEK